MAYRDEGRPEGRERVRVHQLLAALSYGDAIGNEALAIQRQLRAAGHESDIFAELVHPRVAHLARPLWEYRAGLLAGDRLHLPLLDRQRRRPARSTTRPTGW